MALFYILRCAVDYWTLDPDVASIHGQCSRVVPGAYRTWARHARVYRLF